MSAADAPSPPRPPRSRLRYVPPPLLFIGTFLAAAQLHRLLPGDALPAAVAPAAKILGTVALACAALLLITAPGLFVLRRTTLIPHGTSRALVTNGPFRFTRNPMYLALATAYLGAALVLNQLWPLALLAFPLWVIHAKIIPREEWALTQAFGDQYRAYQQRVRRWL